jgi:hypothetical protein
MSKPASPVSHQLFMGKQSSTHQLHNENDGGLRVTYSQSNSNGNQVSFLGHSQKESVENQDEIEGEVAHPLLNHSTTS